MRQLALSCGAIVLIDDEDWETVAAHKWHVSHNGYAIRRVRKPDGTKPIIYMHKVIFGDSGKFDIDHADGNKINNSRSNLRLATRTMNNANTKPRVGCSSRFKGVAWVKRYRRWWSYINKGGKRIHIGYFDDELQAAVAYNNVAVKIFGEFARLNQT